MFLAKFFGYWCYNLSIHIGDDEHATDNEPLFISLHSKYYDYWSEDIYIKETFLRANQWYNTTLRLPYDVGKYTIIARFVIFWTLRTVDHKNKINYCVNRICR